MQHLWLFIPAACALAAAIIVVRQRGKRQEQLRTSARELLHSPALKARAAAATVANTRMPPRQLRLCESGRHVDTGNGHCGCVRPAAARAHSDDAGDDGFASSLAVAAVTNSVVLGYAVGGNLAGAAIGDALRSDPTPEPCTPARDFDNSYSPPSSCDSSGGYSSPCDSSPSCWSE